MWITGPDRKIHFVNEKAEEILGRPARDCIGQPCFRVVGACDTKGTPFCARRCPILTMAEGTEAVEPVALQFRPRRGRVRWIQLLCIPEWAPDGTGPWLVHCALDARRARRFEDYLTTVASRTRPCDVQPDQRLPLTPRQRQVLAHLANDEDLPTVAAKLHVSHVTVRNHVQHILAKLGVHSMPEAVALFLLDRV